MINNWSYDQFVYAFVHAPCWCFSNQYFDTLIFYPKKELVMLVRSAGPMVASSFKVLLEIYIPIEDIDNF